MIRRTAHRAGAFAVSILAGAGIGFAFAIGATRVAWWFARGYIRDRNDRS